MPSDPAFLIRQQTEDPKLAIVTKWQHHLRQAKLMLPSAMITHLDDSGKVDTPVPLRQLIHAARQVISK